MKSSVLVRLSLALVAAAAFVGGVGCVVDSGPEPTEQVQANGATLGRSSDTLAAPGAPTPPPTTSNPTNAATTPGSPSDVNANDPGPHPWVPRPPVVNAIKRNAD